MFVASRTPNKGKTTSPSPQKKEDVKGNASGGYTLCRKFMISSWKELILYQRNSTSAKEKKVWGGALKTCGGVSLERRKRVLEGKGDESKDGRKEGPYLKKKPENLSFGECRLCSGEDAGEEKSPGRGLCRLPWGGRTGSSLPLSIQGRETTEQS